MIRFWLMLLLLGTSIGAHLSLGEWRFVVVEVAALLLAISLVPFEQRHGTSPPRRANPHPDPQAAGQAS